MGASQSSGQTRSVNIENQSPIGVIDVSDEVVQRLKRGLAKDESSKKLGQQAETVTKTTSDEAPAVAVKVPSSGEYATPMPSKPIVKYANPVPPANSYTGIYSNEPSITAIEVRRQKEIELQQNDLYWRQRMTQLEQTLNKTNTIMEKEYSAAVDDVKKRFTNAPPTHQLPPCQDLKAQLITCYRVNPGETLKCSDEVAAFTNCVGQNRCKRLDEAAADSPKAKEIY